MPWTNAKASFFSSALSIVHCHIISILLIFKSDIGYPHTAWAQCDPTLLTNSNPRFIIKEMIGFTTKTLILICPKNILLCYNRHMTFGAFFQLQVRLWWRQIARPCSIFIDWRNIWTRIGTWNASIMLVWAETSNILIILGNIYRFIVVEAIQTYKLAFRNHLELKFLLASNTNQI